MSDSAASAVVVTMHGIRRSADDRAMEGSAASRYTIDDRSLGRLLDAAKSRLCCTVQSFSEAERGERRVLTFDDGRVSDYTLAFPMLQNRRLVGTFYVTARHVGCDGYTNVAQLREMAAGAMEIGSHGLTHRYLTVMSRAEAIREIQESKDRLEQLLGQKVASFAAVGGHYCSWMLDAAAEAGYRTFATMVPGRSSPSDGLTVLRRNHVQSHHTADQLMHIVDGRWGMQAKARVRYFLLSQPKRWLGLKNYDRLKGLVLRLRESPSTEPWDRE